MKLPKKLRNKARNERKAHLRALRVSRENELHDKTLMANAFLEGKLMTPSAAKAIEDPEIVVKVDEVTEDDPYSLMRVIEAAKEYRKLDPDKFLLMTRPVYQDKEQTEVKGYVACIVAMRETGPETVNSTSQWFKTIEAAVRYAGRDLPVIGIKTTEGNVVYPFYNEAKGTAMREARERRAKRQAKAAKHLGLVVAVGTTLGGLK